jgi:hypothetical protein
MQAWQRVQWLKHSISMKGAHASPEVWLAWYVFECSSTADVFLICLPSCEQHAKAPAAAHHVVTDLVPKERLSSCSIIRKREV